MKTNISISISISLSMLIVGYDHQTLFLTLREHTLQVYENKVLTEDFWSQKV